jgi:NADH:ubiquinone oxidoreductase subunit F (NADH-binding)
MTTGIQVPRAADTTAPLSGPPREVLRLLAGWADTGRPAGFAEHLQRYGPAPFGSYRGRHGRQRLIDVVGRAGLRGRGGGGFPTGRKLAAVAAQRGRPVVVANGCEGDPASTKDLALLQLAPHLVIDGMLLSAAAVGAREAILCVHRGSPVAEPVRAALHERALSPAGVRVVEVPTAYVASESSALVNYLTTGDARPTVTPPRMAESGVRGRPTLVDNVETLAHLALIARYGSDWYRRVGTKGSPGTTLATVGGAVRHPGVYEVELGRSLAAVLRLAGGPTEPLQALQVGGLGGTWLPIGEALGLALTHDDCPGVAAVVALPARACGLAETAEMLRYLAQESAHQCGPCLFGLPAIAGDLADLTMPVSVASADAALRRLRRRLPVVAGRGACSHPDGAVRLAGSALQTFADDVTAHAAGRPCPSAGPPSRIPVPRPTPDRTR